MRIENYIEKKSLNLVSVSKNPPELEESHPNYGLEIYQIQWKRFDSETGGEISPKIEDVVISYLSELKQRNQTENNEIDALISDLQKI